MSGLLLSDQILFHRHTTTTHYNYTLQPKRRRRWWRRRRRRRGWPDLHYKDKQAAVYLITAAVCVFICRLTSLSHLCSITAGLTCLQGAVGIVVWMVSYQQSRELTHLADRMITGGGGHMFEAFQRPKMTEKCGLRCWICEEDGGQTRSVSQDSEM